MFPKSVVFFQLKEKVNFDDLSSKLPEFKMKEIGAQDLFTFGSYSLIRGSEVWSIQSSNCMLFRLCKEEKVLPSSVLREELEKKVSEIELIEGRKVGRKEKSDIKDELIYTLRPKCFSKLSDVWMHIDNDKGFIAIYSTASTMIELSFKHIQTMLGSFPITPLQMQVSPSALMTEWLLENELPVSMETGSECAIKDNSEDNAKIAFTSLEPLSEDVTRHLEQGMGVKSLALRWGDKVGFVLHDDLSLRKIKFDDALKEAAFNDSQGGSKSDMDASFSLASLTIREFYDSLCGWFGIDGFGVDYD